LEFVAVVLMNVGTSLFCTQMKLQVNRIFYSVT